MTHVPLLAALVLAACDGKEREMGHARYREPAIPELYSGSGRDGPEAMANSDRLCLRGVAEGPDEVRFALVTLGDALERGRAACSGLGRAKRTRDALTLTMAGDGDCTFTARIADERIRFPEQVPEGCSYYCSEEASLAGQAFALSEAGDDAARRAVDLVGDPLCP
jgi:hypothetical protein